MNPDRKNVDPQAMKQEGSLDTGADEGETLVREAEDLLSKLDTVEQAERPQVKNFLQDVRNRMTQLLRRRHGGNRDALLGDTQFDDLLDRITQALDIQDTSRFRGFSQPRKWRRGSDGGGFKDRK